MEKTTIFKRFKDNLVQNDGWFEITIKECLNTTEGLGYFEKGTVIKMLKFNFISHHDQLVSTPVSEYKLVLN